MISWLAMVYIKMKEGKVLVVCFSILWHEGFSLSGENE